MKIFIVYLPRDNIPQGVLFILLGPYVTVLRHEIASIANTRDKKKENMWVICIDTVRPGRSSQNSFKAD